MILEGRIARFMWNSIHQFMYIETWYGKRGAQQKTSLIHPLFLLTTPLQLPPSPPSLELRRSMLSSPTAARQDSPCPKRSQWHQSDTPDLAAVASQGAIKPEQNRATWQALFGEGTGAGRLTSDRHDIPRKNHKHKNTNHLFNPNWQKFAPDSWFPRHTILYCTVLCCTVLYYTVLYYTIQHYTTLDYTILYCTVLYCTVLYYTVLYCTVLY